MMLLSKIQNNFSQINYIFNNNIIFYFIIIIKIDQQEINLYDTITNIGIFIQQKQEKISYKSRFSTIIKETIHNKQTTYIKFIQYGAFI